MKERQTKKTAKASEPKEDRKFDRDLTPEDIARLQEKIRKDQAAKARPYQKAALIDWQKADAGGEKDFFENEKKDVAKQQEQQPSKDYFNSDFF